jgi:hypothetical protein
VTKPRRALLRAILLALASWPFLSLGRALAKRPRRHRGVPETPWIGHL